jgi:hypothetical protein
VGHFSFGEVGQYYFGANSYVWILEQLGKLYCNSPFERFRNERDGIDRIAAQRKVVVADCDTIQRETRLENLYQCLLERVL